MCAEQEAKRISICLNGLWQIEESAEAGAMPERYGHTITIPGFVSSAEPAFPNAGEFATRDYHWNNLVINMTNPGGEPVPVDREAMAQPIGKSLQTRNYFWYRRTFRVPEGKTRAILCVRKAQFGSKIWVNGVPAGERLSCMTAGQYDVSGLLRWGEENEIVIRVGAHPGVLPKEVVVSQDFEKISWMPGLWDDVELYCFDGPAIENVYVGTHIAPKEIVVRTVLRNPGDADVTVSLRHAVKPGRPAGGSGILGSAAAQITVPAGGTAECTLTVPVPDAALWCPENPVLYDLVTETDGDCSVTRVGVREFRFDTATKSAYLNGRKIFLRGGLVAFGRLTEDTTSGTLPWDEAWVRRAIGERARSMHWNILKLCIHAVPDRWLQIADEEGMLLLSEFPIWLLTPQMFAGYTKPWLTPEHVKPEMTAWMLDQVNHPSVLWFNSCLETYMPWICDVVREIRSLDPGNRPWSNSWMPPVDPDDPVEDHQYEYCMNGTPKEWGYKPFRMKDLEKKAGAEIQSHGEMPCAHPVVITEYGWLFLDRKGDPALLTRRTYNDIEFPAATADERFLTHAYVHAGLTEYWRAFRNVAGIIQISYLAWNDPGKCSSGYLSDLETLQFHPYFEALVKDAFDPLGVYLSFWKPQLKYFAPPEDRPMAYYETDTQILWTMICNDDDEPRSGELVISLEKENARNGKITSAGEVYELARTRFEVGPLGQTSIRTDVKVPQLSGRWTLKATAVKEDGTTVTSRRWVEVI